MNTINVKAPAKINLFLEVINKRADGYHNIQTIMQTVGLYDEIVFEIMDEDKIELQCNISNLATNETNIVYKAAKALKSEFGIKKGVKIFLKKEIPMGAGLGGGSSDAAATLKALSKLWEISISDEQMLKISSKLGADVAFFLTGGTALCEGIGDIVKPLKSIGSHFIVLVNPGFEVSTPSVFKRIAFPLTKKSEIHKIASLISDGKFNKNNVSKALFNRLEEFVFPYYSDILQIKTVLSRLGCASLMSGSGATVFGIIESRNQLEYIKSELKKYQWKIWFTTLTTA